MGLRKAFRKLWRYFHPQYRAMSQGEINEIDRAVSESMAKGSFGTRLPAPETLTGDQLWSLDDTDTVPPMNNERLMSMSSHRSAGRLSVTSSSWAGPRDSGYGEQYFRPPSHRQYQQMYYQQDPYRRAPYDQQNLYEQYDQYPHEQSRGYYQQDPPESPAARYHRRSYVSAEGPYDITPAELMNVHG